MSDKFRNKYRISSIRLQKWDYGCNAMYFVTICTLNRDHFLGEIVNNIMVLSEIGKIADQCWLDIPNHFPFVTLGEYVLMPNHIHGIIIIDKTEQKSINIMVETQDVASLQQPTLITPLYNKFGPQSQNLASIIRGFKIGVTKFARNNQIDFGWQSRFHDHIIRNNESYHRISNYITLNPTKWKEDKFYH